MCIFTPDIRVTRYKSGKVPGTHANERKVQVRACRADDLDCPSHIRHCEKLPEGGCCCGVCRFGARHRPRQTLLRYDSNAARVLKVAHYTFVLNIIHFVSGPHTHAHAHARAHAVVRDWSQMQTSVQGGYVVSPTPTPKVLTQQVHNAFNLIVFHGAL